jgi:hypothetical protein
MGWMEKAKELFDVYPVDVNAALAALLFVFVIFCVLVWSTLSALWRMARKRKSAPKIKKMDDHVYLWGGLFLDRLIVNLREKGEAMSSGDELRPLRRVYSFKEIRTILGDVFHDVAEEAVKKKRITPEQARAFKEFAAFRLGDWDLMPIKQPVPPPPASMLKEAIRKRIKNGGPKPKLPKEDHQPSANGFNPLAKLEEAIRNSK